MLPGYHMRNSIGMAEHIRFGCQCQSAWAESKWTHYLTFGDESIANRVADAFKHAADLCRKKDVF